MKLIGAEIRVGVENCAGLQEAKLIPLEIVFPAIKGNYRHSQNLAEVTFHTSEGDVTMRVVLPRNRIEVEDHKLSGAWVSDPAGSDQVHPATTGEASLKRLHPLVQPPAPEPQLGDRTTVPFFLRGEAAESVTPSPDQGRGTEASPLHEFVARGQAAQRAVDEALSSIAAANVARATPDSAISHEQHYRERPSRKGRK